MIVRSDAALSTNSEDGFTICLLDRDAAKGIVKTAVSATRKIRKWR
jgi:hypothetical protein